MVANFKKFSKDEFKEKVKKRDGRCMNCGRVFGLQSHHILSLGSGGDDVLENGITFCIYCHIPKFHDQNYKYKVKESWLSKSQLEYIKMKRWEGWGKIEWDI